MDDDSEALARALSCWFRNAGTATADRMPMMITTISSSTSVKPACSLLRFLELWRRWNSARWARSLDWRLEVMEKRLVDWNTE